jgi:hypothetical protein
MILQIIMKRNFDPIIAAENAVGYARMTGIYNGAGFKSYFSYAKEIDDVSSVVSENKPDLVLCGIDHLPDKIGNVIISHNVHKWFESHNVNYVGSDPETIELALSKVALKRRWDRMTESEHRLLYSWMAVLRITVPPSKSSYRSTPFPIS